MKWKFLNTPIDACPYAPRSKMVEPVTTAAAASIAPAVISGLGSVISSIFGFGSNANSNETNLKIAQQNAELQRETNAQQYQMFKEQQAFDVDMWNKQNAYNDPSQQVQRLLAAGINPAAVFGNGSVAQASQLTSPAAPQLHSPQIDYRQNPYQPNIDTNSAVNAYMQSELNNSLRKKYNAEAAHTETLNLFEQRGMEDRLRSLQALARRDDALGDMARVELDYAQASQYWRLKQLRNDVALQGDQFKLNQEQINAHRINNALAEVQLAYAPRLNDAQLKQYYETVKQIRAQIGLITANAMLTNEQKLTEIERRTGQIIDNGLKGLSYQVQSATKQVTIDTAKEQLYMLEDERHWRPYQWNYEMTGKAGQYLPNPAGQYGAAEIWQRNRSRDRFK